MNKYVNYISDALIFVVLFVSILSPGYITNLSFVDPYVKCVFNFFVPGVIFTYIVARILVHLKNNDVASDDDDTDTKNKFSMYFLIASAIVVLNFMFFSMTDVSQWSGFYGLIFIGAGIFVVYKMLQNHKTLVGPAVLLMSVLFVFLYANIAKHKDLFISSETVSSKDKPNQNILLNKIKITDGTCTSPAFEESDNLCATIEVYYDKKLDRYVSILDEHRQWDLDDAVKRQIYDNIDNQFNRNDVNLSSRVNTASSPIL